VDFPSLYEQSSFDRGSPSVGKEEEEEEEVE